MQTARTLSCPECGTAFVAGGVKYCANCGASLSGFEAEGAGSEPLAAGTHVGTYRIIELLGEGGMGRVYSAEHTKLGRKVAVKMLRPEFVGNPMALGRFFAEARAVNRISHENIVEITDFLEKPGGDNAYIMELLRGEDLGIRLLRNNTPPLSSTLEIAIQIASALGAVHTAGIVHRDLKPDNVFLIERGGNPNFVKLLDFGVAKLTDVGLDGTPMQKTAVGQIIGTPEYMSPEQAGGQPIDFRSDLYALGVILYEMVTGSLPFQAKSFGELVIKHMTVAVKPPSQYPGLPYEVPAVLEELILDLLAKDASERPESMQVVEDRLRDMVATLDLPVSPRAMTTGRIAVIKRPGSDPSRPPSGTRDSTDRAVKQIALAPTLDKASLSMSSLPTAPVRRLPLVLGIVGAVAVAAVAIIAFGGLGGSGGSTSTSAAKPVAPADTSTAQPEMIRIKFASAPTGATVRVAGTDQPIGITPFTKSFVRSDKAITFEFEKLGHISATEEVSLGADAAIASALSPMPPLALPAASAPVANAPGRKGSATKRRPKNPGATTDDRGGTMSVFPNK